MNILTFDIEEWYTYKLRMGSNDRYLPVLDKLLNDLLDLLDNKGFKATFFCLGIVAREYPEIIKRIHSRGHEIACHSDMHIWLHQLNRKDFYEDTKKSIDSLEQVIGEKIRGYRAPAFSIGESNKWAFEVLKENGIDYDCSIFPAARDFGGFPGFPEQDQIMLNYNGFEIKEFPVTTTNIFFGKAVAYSGGGYFRFFPYKMIKTLINTSEYVMTYFHLKDLDIKQKRTHSSLKGVKGLFRYFKSYYGLNKSYSKLNKLLSDFKFINVRDADQITDWSEKSVLRL